MERFFLISTLLIKVLELILCELKAWFKIYPELKLEYFTVLNKIE